MSVKASAFVWDMKCPATINGHPFRPSHKYVLVAYADHADHEGRNVWPAVKTIVKKTGLDERTVQRLTRENELMGLLVADGTGPHGTHKWFIPLVAGDTLPPRHPAGGDNDDKSLGDNQSPPLGDTVPPELLTGTKDNEEENEILHLLAQAAVSLWPKDPQPWRAIAKELSAPSVTITRSDHTIAVAGLGEKAAFYQDRYARSFEHALAGVTNEDIAVEFRE